MKKFLFALLATTLATPALAAQRPVAQISSVTASREALRTAINTQLAAVQANFDEVYAVIDAGPVYTNTTAPADTNVVWIDTDQDNAIKVYVGGAWTVVGGGGSYTLPTAAADTLGGVKVGDRLSIADGILSADIQSTDISGKEDALGNPASSGYVLSSTDAGVRSWVAQTTDTDTDTLGDMTCTEGQIAKMGSSGWECNTDDVASAGTGDDLGNASAGDVVALFSGTGDYLKTDGTKGTPAGDNLGSATYSSVVGLWTTCTGYLKSDGTCDFGGGSMTYPGAGVPLSTGSAWGTSYTVGTAANNLVQLNASAQLPAVSGALLTNIPLPSWLPSSAPTADNMIIQATGGCSNITYTDQATCEGNSGTWTPPVGAWTSIIDGLINDAGTGTDDLLSASEINTRISSATAFYQAADGDLDTAAGASAAGNSKLFGTNSSGVVGWYDIPVDTDTDNQTASEVGFTPAGSIAATDVQAAVQEVRDEAEPALGNPATTGYVLSSTTAGVRSWVAQSGGTGGTDEFVYLADCSTITNGICVDTDDGAAYYWDGTTVTAVGSGGTVNLTAPGPIGSVTPNTGAFTTLVADSFDFTAPVSGTTGEIGLQEDPDNGSSLVTLKAPASLAADLVFTLPTTYAGAANYALVEDGAGTLSWADVVLVSEIGTAVQAYDADLADLADGSLSGGKVGTGINAANLSTGTLPDARLSAAVAKFVAAPTTANDTCTAGQMAYASGYLYVCIAANTWQRATMATW